MRYRLVWDVSTGDPGQRKPGSITKLINNISAIVDSLMHSWDEIGLSISELKYRLLVLLNSKSFNELMQGIFRCRVRGIRT